MVNIFLSWFSKIYLSAASGFAVSVCRGVGSGLKSYPGQVCELSVQYISRNEETLDRGEVCN